MKKIILSIMVLFTVRFVSAEPSPYPPALKDVQTVKQWAFDQEDDIWPTMNQSRVQIEGGRLQIQSLGEDPYLRIPLSEVQGPIILELNMRSNMQGPMEIFYASTDSPAFDPKKSIRVNTAGNMVWRTYTIRIPFTGQLKVLRIDPGTSLGTAEIESAEVRREIPHEVQIETVSIRDGMVRYSMSDGHRAEMPLSKGPPFESYRIGKAPVTRNVFLHRPEAQTDWLRVENDSLAIHAAPDGSGARILLEGKLRAILCPIVKIGNRLPALTGAVREQQIFFEGEETTVEISLKGEDIRFKAKSKKELTGPVVRVPGSLEQGLLSGVEYLGRNERSSSTIDLTRPEHIRFEPDPDLITMPLMAIITDAGSASMTWHHMNLQPVFSAPNRYDGTGDHLMALKGTSIEAEIRVGASYAEGARLEDSILQVVRQHAGSKIIPAPPRSESDQKVLSLKALNEALYQPGKGWKHALADRFNYEPFCDIASSTWRLSGKMPEMDRLVPGGSHIPDWIAYFLTGRTSQWLDLMNQRAKRSRDRQQPDGSFLYQGKYRRGHFEDTASGICALPAKNLLEHALWTGNRESLEAGLKTLEYMKRFRTPRGAQTWEIPVHTPDILASAYLVWANVLGFELTGEAKWLEEAKRWALTGLPFVYQWGNRPIMRYATISVLGATDWDGVVWIGLPVQWCGGVYAYALTRLAAHDPSFNWNRFARGILYAAEQMQYPEGERAGCLPDAFHLSSQRRLPADINPCAIWNLREALNGNPVSVQTAFNQAHRIVAPFPVSIEGNQAKVEGRKGVTYRVLIDGVRVVEIESVGRDVLPL